MKGMFAMKNLIAFMLLGLSSQAHADFITKQGCSAKDVKEAMAKAKLLKQRVSEGTGDRLEAVQAEIGTLLLGGHA